MSATLFEPVELPADPVACRPTLERLVAGLWSDVRFSAQVSCPLCGGAMHPQPGSGPIPVGARCADCQTTLG